MSLIWTSTMSTYPAPTRSSSLSGSSAAVRSMLRSLGGLTDMISLWIPSSFRGSTVSEAIANPSRESTSERSELVISTRLWLGPSPSSMYNTETHQPGHRVVFVLTNLATCIVKRIELDDINHFFSTIG